MTTVQCPQCKHSSTKNEWNYATQEKNIIPITRVRSITFFRCPKCETYHHALDLLPKAQ